MKRRSRPDGFTLIELMIVVAIIGTLAAIAIPKFAGLIRKSGEGASKGNLGALRSAMSIYYGDLEGQFPGDLAALTVGATGSVSLPEMIAFMSGTARISARHTSIAAAPPT